MLLLEHTRWKEEWLAKGYEIDMDVIITITSLTNHHLQIELFL